MKARIDRPGDPDRRPAEDAHPPSADPDETTLERIQRVGELRIGYNPDVIPFCYTNLSGDLVGFDIAYAYQLARDLDVDLRLVPFTWQELEQDLAAGRFDLAASGIYVTDERLQRFMITEPYFQSPLALIVRADQVHRFLDRTDLRTRQDLGIAVFDDPVMIDLAQRLFQQARVDVLPSYDDLHEHPEIDAALWTEEQAKAWARPGSATRPYVPGTSAGRSSSPTSSPRTPPASASSSTTG